MALSSPDFITWTSLSLWLMLLCSDLTNGESKPSLRLSSQNPSNILRADEFEDCLKSDCRGSDIYNEDILDNNMEFAFNPHYAQKMAHSKKSEDLVRDFFRNNPMDSMNENIYLPNKAWDGRMPNDGFNSLQYLRNGAKRDTGVTNAFTPYSQIVTSHSCSCGEESKLVDLGAGHYPRYLTKSVCVPLVNWLPPNQCRSKILQVAVLKHRAEGDVQNVHAPQLPPVLRGDWMFEVVQLPVACDCMP